MIARPSVAYQQSEYRRAEYHRVVRQGSGEPQGAWARDAGGIETEASQAAGKCQSAVVARLDDFVASVMAFMCAGKS
jgi:hypothetical protein